MHFLPWVWTIESGLKDVGKLGDCERFFTEWFGNSYKMGNLLTYGCFTTRSSFREIIFYMSRGEQCPISDGFYSTCLCIIFLFRWICALVSGGSKSIYFCFYILVFATLYLVIFYWIYSCFSRYGLLTYYKYYLVIWLKIIRLSQKYTSAFSVLHIALN